MARYDYDKFMEDMGIDPDRTRKVFENANKVVERVAQYAVENNFASASEAESCLAPSKEDNWRAIWAVGDAISYDANNMLHSGKKKERNDPVKAIDAAFGRNVASTINSLFYYDVNPFARNGFEAQYDEHDGLAISTLKGSFILGSLSEITDERLNELCDVLKIGLDARDERINVFDRILDMYANGELQCGEPTNEWTLQRSKPAWYARRETALQFPNGYDSIDPQHIVFPEGKNVTVHLCSDLWRSDIYIFDTDADRCIERWDISEDLLHEKFKYRVEGELNGDRFIIALANTEEEARDAAADIHAFTKRKCVESKLWVIEDEDTVLDEMSVKGRAKKKDDVER